MSEEWSPEEEQKLANHIISNVRKNLDGSNCEYCLFDYPRDRFFIGNLRPRPSQEEEQNFLKELLSKLAPIAFGAEFKINNTDENFVIPIRLKWSCFYKIFPDYDEQINVQEVFRSEESDNSRGKGGGGRLYDNLSDEDSDDDVIDTYLDKASKQTYSKDDLLIKFKKLICNVSHELTIIKNEDQKWQIDLNTLREKIKEEFKRVQEVILDDPNRFKVRDEEDERVKVKPEELESKESFDRFKNEFKKEVLPEWEWDISVQIRSEKKGNETEYNISFEFLNKSSQQENQNIESFFFNPQAEFEFEKKHILPFEIDLAPESFRYDRHIWGKGFNCNIDSFDKDNSSIEFKTNHVPIYFQNRYVTQTKPKSRFDELAKDPIPTLNSVLEEMNNYKEEWEKAEIKYEGLEWDWSNFKDEFKTDKQKYLDEIHRFKEGLNLIKNDDDVKLAFKLLNQTFQKLGKQKGYDGWRLFQLAFIVTQIPGIYGLEADDEKFILEREIVDIIYFPTGGGKTEAYLGTIIFHLFYDRLRGKKAGVSVWTRFPLRLLTLQQTQRIANVIGNAELIRREQSDNRLNSKEVNEFSVGYFVGKGGSPNEIYNTEGNKYASPEARHNWSKANDNVIRQQWKRITHCPSCNTESVNVDFDSNHKLLIHRCMNDDCEFIDGRIPIYVVDNEIYRYLPSILVGTIDKLAGLGNQRKFAQLLGEIDSYCPDHGFARKECCQKDCQSRDLHSIDSKYVSGPDLFIQDELHLLEEGLGTFDGHYETFIQELLRQYGKDKPLKIIASSATIEMFERQVQHLYGRSRQKARVFPGPGPSLQESFYATTKKYPQRLFVGILPHNKTIFNSILELIEEYHKIVENLYRRPHGKENPYGGDIPPGTTQWKNLLDLYLTSLTYFLANRQLDEIHTDLKSHVNPRLLSSNSKGIKVHELTGSTSTDEVANILSKVESTASFDEERDAVLANKMVSHGVDIDRFNSMVFYGMPRQNAEYIQASSRVGRSHVGIVFNCLHPARERDRSHYLYFNKFHEYLGQLVEPVAINRWAKYAIDRTLPGLFMATWLQLVSNQFQEKKPGKYYFKDYISKAIAKGLISENDFIHVLNNAYLNLESRVNDEENIEIKIRETVRLFFDQLSTTSHETKWLSEVFSPHRPMRSLRDVDEQIPIELDSLGSEWHRNSNQ